MNECGETEYREENLDDQIKIFFLESGFREGRVRGGISGAITELVKAP